VHVKLLPGDTEAGQVFDTARPEVFDTGVGVGVRPPVGVLVGARVGVAVGVTVAVLVREGVAVGVADSVCEGVGVVAVLTVIVALPLLFDITGSASFAITPATTLSGTACSGMTLIATVESPVAAQVTVVEGSPLEELAAQPEVEPEALHVTAGWKIAMTVTPDVPAGADTPRLTVNGTPTVALAGITTPASDRSADWARMIAARAHASPTSRAVFRDE
jgi:hypothetical protein